jgi:hypothetical protein
VKVSAHFISLGKFFTGSFSKYRNAAENATLAPAAFTEFLMLAIL